MLSSLLIVVQVRTLIVLKVAAHSSGWRSSSFFYVVYLDYSLLILGGMANSDDSASSSPDPLVELEAEVRVLRRRVRRQGNFLQPIDELGGRRLDRIDEDMGRIRLDFMAALRVLEEKVTIALENLDLRL